LPIVGIEIEGTKSTTKTMAADVANIAALGTKLGLLIVSEHGERGIYRRAARAVRSVRRSFGDLVVVPMVASWLDQLTQRSWTKGASSVPLAKPRAPAGGETLEWSAATRTWLRKLGHKAGFDVVEPYVPEVLNATFEAERRRRREPLRHLVDPLDGRIEEMTKFGEFLTACKVDMAWLMPLPSALRDFLGEVGKLDPNIIEHGLLLPELHGHVAVAGFELESSSGKHAAGGLLSLAAYGVLGIGVAPDPGSGKELEDILRRYRPTLGLRNVRVLVHP
jgi:hypothetical protein